MEAILLVHTQVWRSQCRYWPDMGDIMEINKPHGKTAEGKKRHGWEDLGILPCLYGAVCRDGDIRNRGYLGGNTVNLSHSFSECLWNAYGMPGTGSDTAHGALVGMQLLGRWRPVGPGERREPGLGLRRENGPGCPTGTSPALGVCVEKWEIQSEENFPVNKVYSEKWGQDRRGGGDLGSSSGPRR